MNNIFKQMFDCLLSFIVESGSYLHVTMIRSSYLQICYCINNILYEMKFKFTPYQTIKPLLNIKRIIFSHGLMPSYVYMISDEGFFESFNKC